MEDTRAEWPNYCFSQHPWTSVIVRGNTMFVWADGGIWGIVRKRGRNPSNMRKLCRVAKLLLPSESFGVRGHLLFVWTKDGIRGIVRERWRKPTEWHKLGMVAYTRTWAKKWPEMPNSDSTTRGRHRLVSK